MDRFEDLVGRTTKMAVFGPGNFWRKMGQSLQIRELVGDIVPTVFIPLVGPPPRLVAGTRWEFKDEHFGAHVFLSISAQSHAGTIRAVSGICLLHAASREAAEWLLETTRDANDEIGGLPASFIVVAGDVSEISPGLKRLGTITHSGILQVYLQHLVNAYLLWKITKPEDRETLKDRRCPVCQGKT
jgi:hypothetical protein